MAIIKVLKRKDASSVIVAIIVAMTVLPIVVSFSSDLSYKLTGLTSPSTEGWKVVYLQPVVNTILELIVLEIIIRLYVAVHNALSSK